MKYLTALTRDLEIARETESKPLGLALKHNDYRALLKTNNTLAVFCCIEEMDSFKDIKEVAERLFKIYSNVKDEAHTISIVPFGHLSSLATNDIEKIKQLLNKLSRSLNNKGVKTNKIEPSTANIFISNIMLFDKMSTVRYGTSEESLKQTLTALIRSFGIKKIFAVLGQIIE